MAEEHVETDKNDRTHHHGGTRTSQGSSIAEDRLKEASEEPSTAHEDNRLKHSPGGGILGSGPHDPCGQTNGMLQQNGTKASTMCQRAMACL